MVVLRSRQIQQRLKKSMQMSRFEEVHTASDSSHALQRVVVNDGQMIAASNVFADKDDVPEKFRLCLLRPSSKVNPFKLSADVFEGSLQIQSQSELFAR